MIDVMVFITKLMQIIITERTRKLSYSLIDQHMYRVFKKYTQYFRNHFPIEQLICTIYLCEKMLSYEDGESSSQMG